MPRVSVVVNHFDRQSLLVEALASIAAQTYRDFEVIVVNDHGADSRNLVDEFRSFASYGSSPIPVRYDYRPANAGVAATRNRGVELATGELIAYLDDDDLWHPGLLEGLVGLLDERPDCGLVYGDAEVWRMERDPSDASGCRPCRRAESRTLAVPFDLDALRQDDFIVPGGMLHRRSLYDTVGGFDETLYVSDDWDWLLRAVAVTGFARLPGIVITVRIWPDGRNLSAPVDARRLAALAEIERRYGTPPLEPKTFWEVAETHARRLARVPQSSSANAAHQPPTPARLIDLADAYQRSTVLFAFIRLGIPTQLAAGARTAGEVAAAVGADRLAMDRFLEAGVSLGLLIREGNRFRNAPDADRFLVRGTPTYLGDELDRHDRAMHSKPWAEFVQRLCSWRFETCGSTIPQEPAVDATELAGKHALSLLAGAALARAIDLTKRHCLLDLGGGTGAMSIELCRRFPAMNGVVLERPEIVPHARAFVAESGLANRIEALPGDLVADPLPRGADVVLLANVVSMFSVETSRAVLCRAFECLPTGGVIVLSGWMLDDEGAGPLASVLFSLEDIVLGAPDVERSAADYAQWLEHAGFRHIERGMYFEPMSFVMGRKP